MGAHVKAAESGAAARTLRLAAPAPTRGRDRAFRKKASYPAPTVEWLNYHHLFYFWVVAKQGSIVRASAELRLAHPTISGQIHRLEDVLGEKLFARRGRALVLTEVGRVAFRYADEIFSLGHEFVETLRGRSSGKPMRLVVGVADVLPPSLVRRFLEPALRLTTPVRVVCRADKSVDEFVAEMALHRVDMVLADGPAAPGIALRAFSHPLGDCGTTFFATAKMAGKLRRGFPRSLDESPFLLPGAPSTIRRALEQWFDTQDIRPTIVAECDDSALAKDFGEQGMGVFAAPSVIEAEVLQHYRVRVVGRSDAVRQEFYAISGERRIKHPAVVAISKAARQDIFARKPT
jgi:LysR family transcriptional regulator, transcriptional activator of nhaA